MRTGIKRGCGSAVVGRHVAFELQDQAKFVWLTLQPQGKGQEERSRGRGELALLLLTSVVNVVMETYS